MKKQLDVIQQKKNTVIDGGKLQPQAPDLEEAVLGAMMLEKNAVSEAIEILKPESFYKEAHQRIFSAILRLFDKSEPVDILSVTNELRSAGELDLCGGVYYISQLTNKVASAANIQFHARVIAQKYILRSVIQVGTSLVKEAFDDTTDCFDLLNHAEEELYRVSEGNIRKDFSHVSQITQQAQKEREIAGQREDGLSGVPTGFTNLDRLTGGWQSQDLIIIAARPGMGKTAFVISMARNIAMQFDKPIAVFSLEMSSIQLVNRLLSGETMIASDDLRRGKHTQEEKSRIDYHTQQINKAPMYIDDTAALSIFELRAKSRRLKAQKGVELIIIDYLQLMTVSAQFKGNREGEISTISRSIKALAKELEIPIIALSQLNRSVESRGGDKRPMLSDLRESGAIEQDADIVAFIYRPEYYGITAYENGESALGVGEIIVSKHRNGALDNVKLGYEAQFAKFTNIEPFGWQPPPLKPNNHFEVEKEDDNLAF